MTTKLKVSVAVTAITGTLLLASCSPGDLLEGALESGVEKGLEAATGGEIDIDTEEGQISFSSDDGDVSFGANTELPNGFPDQVSLPDGDIVQATRTADGDAETFTVTVLVPGGMNNVYDDVTSRLERDGFEQEQHQDMGDMANVVYTGSGDVNGVAANLIGQTDADAVAVTYVVQVGGEE